MNAAVLPCHHCDCCWACPVRTPVHSLVMRQWQQVMNAAVLPCHHCDCCWACPVRTPVHSLVIRQWQQVMNAAVLPCHHCDCCWAFPARTPVHSLVMQQWQQQEQHQDRVQIPAASWHPARTAAALLCLHHVYCCSFCPATPPVVRCWGEQPQHPSERWMRHPSHVYSYQL